MIIVRWQVVGEGRTGTIERQCARLTEQIWSGKVTNRSAIITSLAELNTSDDEFRTRFTEQENLSKQKAIYFLKRIEEHELSKTLGTSVKGLEPHANLSLEHILPLNPGEEWNAVVKANPKIVDHSGRTGNFCLLPPSSNKNAGNAGFANKRAIYAASDLLTTQQAAKYEHWNEETIRKRQIWLASRAVVIWRIST